MLALIHAKEEIALPLRGRKNNLTKRDLLSYFAKDLLKLTPKVIDEVVIEFEQAISLWPTLIENSFLSYKMQQNYLSLLDDRTKRLGF